MYSSRLLLVGYVGLSGLASILGSGSIKLGLVVAANLSVVGVVFSARENADLALSDLYPSNIDMLLLI